MQSPRELSQSNGCSREEQNDLNSYAGLSAGLSVSFLRRHATAIASSAGATTLAALLYLLAVEPTYTARAQVLIDPGIANVVREQSIDDVTSKIDSERVESEIAVLRSEAVALAVIDQLKLVTSPEPGWLGFFKTAYSKDQLTRKTLMEFATKLKAKRIGVSEAVEISFSSPNPEQAARVVNSITDAYIDFQLNSRAEAGRVATLWLEKRLAELRNQMNSAERKLQVYRAARNYSIGGTERPSNSSKPVDTSVDNAAPKTPNATSEPITMEDLESTASAYRKIYETFLQTSMATAQRVSFPIANVRVITRASPPLTQDRSPLTIVLFSALIGAIAGAALGLVRERRSAGSAQQLHATDLPAPTLSSASRCPVHGSQ